jgi:hypothetical protein
VQAFGRVGPSALASQKRYLHVAIELMHMMSAAAGTLTRLPARAGCTDTNAGMSFTMLRSVEPLLDGPSERLLMRERLRELADGARAFKGRSLSMASFEPQLTDLLACFDK